MVEWVRREWIIAEVRERTKWRVGNNEEKQQQLAKAIMVAVPDHPDEFSEEDATAAVELAVEFVERAVFRRVGRKEHPGKEWYRMQGVKIRPMKLLRKQMQAAVGSAPSDVTIRLWEKEIFESN